MKEVTEFEEIGRNSQFKVPEGFFEQISEKTLQKAKQREQNHRKIILTLRTFAVAASLFAIALLGYFMSDAGKPEVKQIVQTKQIEKKINETRQLDKKQTIRQTAKTDKQITIAEIKKVAPAKTDMKEIIPENLTDVLPELSDDELLLLAAMYKADLFIDESQN
jgi:hypothetical protein